MGRPQWQPEEIHGALVQLSALATVSLHLGARGSYCLRDSYSRRGTPLQSLFREQRVRVTVSLHVQSVCTCVCACVCVHLCLCVCARVYVPVCLCLCTRAWWWNIYEGRAYL